MFKYSFCKSCLSLWVDSNCSDNFFANPSSSFLSWMCYYNSFESFSHSFSWSSLLLPKSIFFFLSSFRSLCSCWYLAFSWSFWFLMWSYYCLSISYSFSALIFSSFAWSNSICSFVDSFLRPSTWLQTSYSCVLLLLSLTANSLKIFSDIIVVRIIN